jgi:opacity protein-like surface antigen
MRFATGAVVLLMSALPVAAADIRVPNKAPAVVRVAAYDWTAVYGGVWVGYHSGDLKLSDCVGICPTDPKLKGVVFGAQFGADYQFANNIVVGAFGAVPLTRLSSTVTPLPGFDFPMETKSVFIGAGRLGYAMNQFLPYALGGFVRARVEGRSNFNGIVQSQSHGGYVAGAGLEYALAKNWSVDGRYTYMSVDQENYNFGGGTVRWGEDSHNVSLALNYRFRPGR